MPKTAAPAVPSITTGGKRKIVAADKSPFTIDDVTYHLIRPKEAILGEAASLLDPTRSWNAQENARVMLQFTARLLSYVEQTPRGSGGVLTGRAHLDQRLADPTDALDLHDLLPLFKTLMEGWFQRPTGSPRASAPRRGASRAAGSRASTR